jgi:hypothetical protein
MNYSYGNSPNRLIEWQTGRENYARTLMGDWPPLTPQQRTAVIDLLRSGAK